jgi:hypothetical protein
MKGKHVIQIGVVCALMLTLLVASNMFALAQEPAGSPLTAAFTYQGRLNSSGVPYNGFCDFQFSLWDSPSGGLQVGATQTVTNVDVVEGYVTIMLDYGGDKFLGDSRWLDISVRCPAGGGNYVPLTPRQMLTATPYALYSMVAPWSGLLGVPPGFADGIDDNTTYTAGDGLMLTDTTFSVDTASIQQRVIGMCDIGNAIRVVNQDGSVICEPVGGGGGDAWLLTGNSGTTPGVNFLGTNDNQAMVFKVNGERALRLEPTGISPNLIGGYIGNWAYSGVYGAVIGGGGDSTNANIVTDSYGTVGGGIGNRAGDNAGTIDDANFATVGGGLTNIASGLRSTIGGGYLNTANGSESTISGGQENSTGGIASTVAGGVLNDASGQFTTVGGGNNNTASEQSSTVSGGSNNNASWISAFIGGGRDNTASGDASTIAGGASNTASTTYTTVAGGYSNDASGYAATVFGGYDNAASGDYSFAAGRSAHATNAGSFVWNDDSGLDGYDYGANTFTVRASGGTWILGDSTNTAALWVNNTTYHAIYANNTGGAVTAYIHNSTDGPALTAWTDSGPLSAYFNADIDVGGCVGCLLIQIGLNAGITALQPGDVVAISGIAEPLIGSSQPILKVHRASVGETVVGVVQARGTRVERNEDGKIYEILNRIEGDIQSGDYLTLVVYGTTQVKADASSGAIAVGTQLTSSEQSGYARAIHTVTIEGVQVAEASSSVGIALESLDTGTGLISVFVTLH